MKKKILITAGVLLLLLGVLVVLPNLVDWNKFKPQFADGVRAATGQEVTIEGELTFKLLPSPAVTAANVSLANVEGGVSENFIELERLDLRVELLPLLSGDLQITSLVLEGGKIFLERDARGHANWEALFAGEGEPDEAQRQVTLESFILRGTDIYYSDLSTGAREEILGINADLVIASLAGTLKTWAALLLPETGRWQDKHRREKQDVLTMDFSTFRNAFVQIPCQIVRTGRRLIYRLIAWNPWQHVFLRLIERLHGRQLC
ncbi:MAG: AsmA family protein [Proteobacteria bacterium]|nr:AsmA family protein [Pseudomonadota bacterium]